MPLSLAWAVLSYILHRWRTVFVTLPRSKVTKVLHSTREGRIIHLAVPISLLYYAFISAMNSTIPSLSPWRLISPLWVWFY